MDYEPLLLEKISKDQLEELIAEKIAKFHGLLTREVAIKLIAREKGLLDEENKKVTISELGKGGKGLIIEAKVKKVWPIVNYRSGKKSRVVEIEDSTGSIPLVLWNDDIELAVRFRSGDAVRVKAAYSKNNELHLSYSGTMELIERAGFTDLGALPQGQFVHAAGFVTRIEGHDRYLSGKSSKLGYSFFLSDKRNEVRVVIWGNPDRGKSLQLGDEVIIEGALVDNERLELSEDARLMVRRKERMLLGKLESMDLEGQLLKVKVGGKEGVLDRQNALKFMGLNLADDISLSAALTLKKSYLLNTNVSARTRIDNGRTIIEG